ncbi:hypothetical protein NDU88_006105 [Pleurodeles waltl]|uniref:Secreted protein n=1 Tax=Pleurodeles waltl TaxID=8319 RepID=A0AAV7MB91_PLEWA|nr:hypothetical protein NDU88_006105 [Pleurodeles waltl]
MKIGVVFLLVAISGCYGHLQPHGSGTYCHPSSGGGVPHTNCFEYIMKEHVKNVLVALQELFCSCDHCKTGDCSMEEWKRMFDQLKTTMQLSGCALNEMVLGKNPTVEEVAEKVGEFLKKLEGPLRKLLKLLKIEQTLFPPVCHLLGKALDNLANLLGDLPEKLDIGGLLGDGSSVGVLGPGLFRK